MSIKEYDENSNLIYEKDYNGYEYWQEFDENNRLIYSKNSDNFESWYEYDKNNNRVNITKEKLKEKEFLSRKYCSRFELIDI